MQSSWLIIVFSGFALKIRGIDIFFLDKLNIPRQTKPEMKNGF